MFVFSAMFLVYALIKIDIDSVVSHKWKKCKFFLKSFKNELKSTKMNFGSQK